MIFSACRATFWHAGLNVGIGPFAVGGGIGIGRDLPWAPGMSSAWNVAAATEADTFELGAAYSLGHATVSLNWSHGEYKQVDDNTDSLDHLQVSVGQWIGPGVQLAAMAGLFEYDDKGVMDNDNSGWQTGVGVLVFW